MKHQTNSNRLTSKANTKLCLFATGTKLRNMKSKRFLFVSFFFISSSLSWILSHQVKPHFVSSWSRDELNHFQRAITFNVARWRFHKGIPTTRRKRETQIRYWFMKWREKKEKNHKENKWKTLRTCRKKWYLLYANRLWWLSTEVFSTWTQIPFSLRLGVISIKTEL